MFVTYPYKEKFSYLNDDKSVRTVSDVRNFIKTIDTVVDEDGSTVSTIIWNDGYFEATDDVPTAFDTRESLQQALNKPPETTSYVKITTSIPEETLKYVEPFKAKGFFPATSIVPTNELELDADLIEIKGTWIRTDTLTNPDYLNSISLEEDGNNDRNLKSIAEELQQATNMGMGRTIVNRDRWGSDHPDIIGDHFLPSRFDGGLQTFAILTTDGNFEDIDLNRRRHLAKLIDHQTR